MCFPYVGAGAAAYRDWRFDLEPGVSLSAVRLPGRERRIRIPPATDLAEVVPELAAAIAATDLPCALVGVCSGSILAFETARELEAAGHPPAEVLLASRPAPDQSAAGSHLADAPLPALLDWLVGLGALPADLAAQPKLTTLIEPALRADLRMTEGYAPPADRRIASPVTVAIGKHDTAMTAASVAGWRDRTTSDFSLRVIDADHLLRGPGRRALLAELTERLRRPLEEEPARR